MVNATPEQLKDIADIFDSRGSLTINVDTIRGKRYYYEQYRLTGDEKILYELQSLFGGTVAMNGTSKALIWRVTADVCRNFLFAVLPWVTERNEEADICIQLGKLRQERSTKEDEKTFLAEAADLRTQLQSARKWM